jgi:predicted site-specific integrase-resolvase
MSKYLSLKELGLLLGLSENSLRYHLRMGRIKPSLKLGTRMLFDVDEVICQLQRDIRRRT